MRRSSVIAGGLAALLLVLSPITAAAATATAGISGLELFPGISHGGTTYGTTFAGWTDSTNAVGPRSWVAPPGTGGIWILSINYTGTAGKQVKVKSGRWWLRMADGTTFFGRVASGVVIWPGAGGWRSGSCGDNATVDLTLVSQIGPGSVKGCLDDQHLDKVFPPHVWGTVTVQTG